MCSCIYFFFDSFIRIVIMFVITTAAYYAYLSAFVQGNAQHSWARRVMAALCF